MADCASRGKTDNSKAYITHYPYLNCSKLLQETEFRNNFKVTIIIMMNL